MPKTWKNNMEADTGEKKYQKRQNQSDAGMPTLGEYQGYGYTPLNGLQQYSYTPWSDKQNYSWENWTDKQDYSWKDWTDKQNYSWTGVDDYAKYAALAMPDATKYTEEAAPDLEKYKALGLPTMEEYVALAYPELQEYQYKDLNYDDFRDQYADYIRDAVSKIGNRDPFTWDYHDDVAYQQYADQYKRGGQMAMEDTMAKLASRTGGLTGSYATAASQQAYNNYMQGLADKIPELRELAYNKYLNELNNDRNDLAMYMNLSNNDYNRYLQDRNLAYNENVLRN